MTMTVPKIWTPDEIADVTHTSKVDVIGEIRSGRLRGFRIGAEFRVSDPVLQAFLAGVDGGPAAEARAQEASATPGNTVTWQPVKAFFHMWPNGQKENYPEAFEGLVSFASDDRRFRIGYTTREAAGRDRRRVVVFLDRGTYLVPVVEFTGTDDFAETSRVVSVIKDQGNKHAKSLAQLPPEYQGFPTVIYNEVVTGPYASRSIAMVVHQDDKDTMLRHALIRAQNKSMLNL